MQHQDQKAKPQQLNVIDRAKQFSNIQCPYCLRRFCQKASEKHIALCREKSKWSNVPKEKRGKRNKVNQIHAIQAAKLNQTQIIEQYQREELEMEMESEEFRQKALKERRFQEVEELFQARDETTQKLRTTPKDVQGPSKVL